MLIDAKTVREATVGMQLTADAPPVWDAGVPVLTRRERQRRAAVAAAPTPERELLAAIERLWHDAVGAVVAQHTVPIGLTAALELIVTCRSSIWKTELQPLTAHITSLLNDRLQAPYIGSEGRFGPAPALLTATRLCNRPHAKWLPSAPRPPQPR